MKPSDDLLRALGLSPSQLGESVELFPSSDREAQGQTLAQTVALTLAMFVQGGPETKTAPIELDLARELGIHLEHARARSSLLVVTSAPGSPLRPTSAGSDNFLVDSNNPATVYADVSRGPVLVTMPSGDGLLLESQGSITQVTQVIAANIDVRPIAALGWPVHEWVKDCGDPWMVTEVNEALAVPGAWSTATAVGLVARLTAAPSNPGAALEALVAGGQMRAHVRRLEEGLKKLTPTEIRDIEDLALAEVDALHRMVDVLEELKLPYKEDLAGVARLLHRRDDLEGALWVLSRVSAGEQVVAATKRLDDRAAPLVRAMPRNLLDDERLRRVLVRNPDAWWAAVVEP